MRRIFHILFKALLSILKLPRLFCQLCEATFYLSKMANHPNCEYFVCPYGIGDTLFLASLMKEYKKYHHVKKVCFIVKTNHRDLPGMFSAIDETIVSDRQVKILQIFAISLRRFRFGNFRYGHFILSFGWPERGLMMGVNGASLMDVYRRPVLNLPFDAQPEIPKVSLDASEMVEWDKSLGIVKHLVVLMPNAVTVERLDSVVFEQLADELIRRGYRVYTNVLNENEPPVKNTQQMILPLKEFYYLSQAYHWSCIALRSGICDMLAFTNVKTIVLHGSEIAYRVWNMKNLRLPNQNMLDILLEGEVPYSKSLEEILSYFPSVV